MKKKRFTKEQVIEVLQEIEGGPRCQSCAQVRQLVGCLDPGRRSTVASTWGLSRSAYYGELLDGRGRDAKIIEALNGLVESHLHWDCGNMSTGCGSWDIPGTGSGFTGCTCGSTSTSRGAKVAAGAGPCRWTCRSGPTKYGRRSL